ncbi:hypothetical protein Tco_0217945 [Tanacetum coccineum]
MSITLKHRVLYNKLDLSYSGLDEFKEPEFKGYGPENSKKESNVVCENSSNETKKNSDAPLIEEWVSDNEDEVESPVVVKKKTVFPTAGTEEFLIMTSWIELFLEHVFDIVILELLSIINHAHPTHLITLCHLVECDIWTDMLIPFLKSFNVASFLKFFNFNTSTLQEICVVSEYRKSWKTCTLSFHDDITFVGRIWSMWYLILWPLESGPPPPFYIACIKQIAIKQGTQYGFVNRPVCLTTFETVRIDLDQIIQFEKNL